MGENRNWKAEGMERTETAAAGSKGWMAFKLKALSSSWGSGAFLFI